MGCVVKARLIPDNVLLEPFGISQQPPTIILTNAFFLLVIPRDWQSLIFPSVVEFLFCLPTVAFVVLPSSVAQCLPGKIGC